MVIAAGGSFTTASNHYQLLAHSLVGTLQLPWYESQWQSEVAFTKCSLMFSAHLQQKVPCP
jgi:hypothetical protein